MSIFKRSDSDPEPVEVALAANQTEADLIQGILREEGIPSMTKKPEGHFLTDLFQMGARYVVVPASAEEEAKKILEDLERIVPLPGE